MGRRRKCNTQKGKKILETYTYTPGSPIKSLLSADTLQSLSMSNAERACTPNKSNSDSPEAQFLTPNTLQSTIAPVITRTFLNDYYNKESTSNANQMDSAEDSVIIVSDIDSTVAADDNISDITVIYVPEESIIDLCDSQPGTSRCSSNADDSVICLLDDTQLEVHKNQLPSGNKRKADNSKKIAKQPKTKRMAFDQSVIVIDDDDDDGDVNNTSKENVAGSPYPNLSFHAKQVNKRKMNVLQQMKSKKNKWHRFLNGPNGPAAKNKKKLSPKKAAQTNKPITNQNAAAIFNQQCSIANAAESHSANGNLNASTANKTVVSSSTENATSKSLPNIICSFKNNPPKKTTDAPHAAAACDNKNASARSAAPETNTSKQEPAPEYYSLDVNSNNNNNNNNNSTSTATSLNAAPSAAGGNGAAAPPPPLTENQYQRTIERYSIGGSLQQNDSCAGVPPAALRLPCTCPPYPSVFCNQCYEAKNRPNTRSQQQQQQQLIGLSAASNFLPPSNVKSNIYNASGKVINKTGLRPIIIDGSNVAMQHSHGKYYSVEGLKLCIDYFRYRGHIVKAFVPQFRLSPNHCTNPDLLDCLARSGFVIFTPSRKCDRRMIVPYDDRYIIQYATEYEGVVVSNDNYRDLLLENPKWRDTIENRLLMFTWVDDMLMFPTDPLGRHGPGLDDFLRFPVPRKR